MGSVSNITESYIRRTAVYKSLTGFGSLSVNTLDSYPLSRAVKLWQEKIVINGRNMEMGVALVDRTLKDALRLLRIKYPDAPLAVNSNSVLFEIPLENGFRRRIFLVGFDGK